MTSVVAEACATIEWLAATPTLAIPVYQREYRWTRRRAPNSFTTC